MELRAQNIRVDFRDRSGQQRRVLDVPDLVFATGSHTCIVGESGCGKTTLLHVLAGIVLPDDGRVLLGDTALTELPEARRDRFRAAHFGYVFQTFNLLPGLSALDNIALAHATGREGSLAAGRLAARELLARVGLDAVRDALPGTLSSGEQQRVAIARAVCVRPAVLLADEPTASLDQRRADEVLALLREVATEAKSTLVLVTHDPRVQADFERVLPFEELGP